MTYMYIVGIVLARHIIYFNRNYTINVSHLKCTSIARVYIHIYQRMYIYIYIHAYTYMRLGVYAYYAS